MKIRELLATKEQPQPITVVPETAVIEAVRLMYQHTIGSVLIAEAPEGQPLGIFTERDVLRLHAQGIGNFDHLPVKEHMTSPLVTGDPDIDLDAALTLMTKHRFRHLPILDEGRLVGIISIGDLVKYKLHEKSQEAEILREYIVT